MIRGLRNQPTLMGSEINGNFVSSLLRLINYLVISKFEEFNISREVDACTFLVVSIHTLNELAYLYKK